MNIRSDHSNRPSAPAEHGRSAATRGPSLAIPDELVSHLCRHSALHSSDAERLIAEVLAYYAENLNTFVMRRHRELRNTGLSNTATFNMIRLEIPHHRFGVEAISVRQIRRIIYG